METWTSYALSDFLMFSAASYFRRYELANAELWPGQPLLIAVAAWLWWSMRRPGPRSGLQVALLLAAVWAFVAGWFLYRHYAQINLAAGWFALAAEALRERGFDVHATCLAPPGPVSRKLEQEGIPVRACGARGIWDMRALLRLRRQALLPSN